MKRLAIGHLLSGCRLKQMERGGLLPGGINRNEKKFLQ